MEVPCHQKSREQKPSHWSLCFCSIPLFHCPRPSLASLPSFIIMTHQANLFLQGETKRESGALDTAWSLIKHRRGKWGRGDAEGTSRYLEKCRWVFMSDMGTRLKITNRFQKAMSHFTGKGFEQSSKRNSLSLSWIPSFRVGSGGWRSHLDMPPPAPAPLLADRTLCLPRCSKLLKWKFLKEECLFFPIINHLFVNGKSQKTTFDFTHLFDGTDWAHMSSIFSFSYT